MALFRFLFAPALLAAAVLAGHGERRHGPPPSRTVEAPARGELRAAPPVPPGGGPARRAPPAR
jgi:hypothetical protein